MKTKHIITGKTSDFKPIPTSQMVDLKFKKWFEINDLLSKFPKGIFFIVKGKKNIGKTHSLKNLMITTAKAKKKFLFLRISEMEAKNLKNEWNADDKFPFSVRANEIFYTTHKEKYSAGKIAWIKNLQALRSLTFQDYQYIFFDEFVAFSPENYRIDTTILAKNFIRLISDVLRNKQEIKIFCFGNNDIQHDFLSIYFNIDQRHPFVCDEQAGVYYFNFKDYYQGANQKMIKGFAKYNPDLVDFFDKNQSFENLDNISFYFNEDEKGTYQHLYAYNGKIFTVCDVFYKIQNKWILNPDFKKIIYFYHSLKTDLKIIALDDTSDIEINNSFKFPEEQTAQLIQTFYYWYKAKKLKFDIKEDERNFKEIIKFRHFKI